MGCDLPVDFRVSLTVDIKLQPEIEQNVPQPSLSLSTCDPLPSLPSLTLKKYLRKAQMKVQDGSV